MVGKLGKRKQVSRFPFPNPGQWRFLLGEKSYSFTTSWAISTWSCEYFFELAGRHVCFWCSFVSVIFQSSSSGIAHPEKLWSLKTENVQEADLLSFCSVLSWTFISLYVLELCWSFHKSSQLFSPAVFFLTLTKKKKRKDKITFHKPYGERETYTEHILLLPVLPVAWINITYQKNWRIHYLLTLTRSQLFASVRKLYWSTVCHIEFCVRVEIFVPFCCAFRSRAFHSPPRSMCFELICGCPCWSTNLLVFSSMDHRFI